MKKLNLAILSISLFLTSAQANASNFYVGIEPQITELKLGGREEFYDTSQFSLGLVGGYSTDLLDFELSFSRNKGKKETRGNGIPGIAYTQSALTYQALSLDLIKNFKVFDKTNVFGLIGTQIANQAIRESIIDTLGNTYQFKSDDTKLGYTIGGGISYDISDEFTLRAKIKYSDVNLKTDKLAGTTGVESIAAYSLGALYHF